MASRRSTAMKRARAEQRREEARTTARRRSRLPELLTFAPLVGSWALLLGADIVQEPALAVVASLVSLGWVAVCWHQSWGWRRWTYGDPGGRAGWRPAWLEDALLVVVAAVMISPSATHQMISRGGGGALELGPAAPGLVDAARVIGWLAVALILLGCPVAARLGRQGRQRV